MEKLKGKKIKTGAVIIVIALILAGVIFMVFFGDNDLFGKKSAVLSEATAKPSGPPVTLSAVRLANNDIVVRYIQNNTIIAEYSIEKYLEGQAIIQDFPEGGVLSLRLYNFNSGEKQWENSYIIKKGSVVKGLADNPDAEITMPSRYIEEIQIGLCGAITKANNNGDVGITLNMGKAAFLWKYNGMMKYKSCFGM
jgi:hypothetical protein